MVVVEPLSGIAACDVEKVLHLSEMALADVYPPDESATVGVCLYVQSALAVAGIVTVLHNDIPHSGRHLAAYDHGVETLEVAPPYDDILRGLCYAPSVVVASALYDYVVVAVVERYVLDEDIA